MDWMLWLALLVTLPLAAAGYASFRRDLAAARARVRTGSQVVATGSGPVEYATMGDGPPLLVLHGASGGWDQGLACARALATSGFRLIAPSRFGYLRTPLPADASAAAEADTWAELLTALRIDRVPVMAFSAGAAPAVQLALRHPDRVSHLLLIVPGAGGIYPQQTMALPRAAALLLEVLYRFDLVMWLAMRLSPGFLQRMVGVPASLANSLTAGDKTVIDETVEMILPASERRLGLLNEGRTQQPGNAYPLDGIAAPTLLVSAADDLYRTLPVARYAASVIPGAQLIEFPTGGHLLLGHEDEIAVAAAAFIRGDRRSAAA